MLKPKYSYFDTSIVLFHLEFQWWSRCIFPKRGRPISQFGLEWNQILVSPNTYFFLSCVTCTWVRGRARCWDCVIERGGKETTPERTPQFGFPVFVSLQTSARDFEDFLCSYHSQISRGSWGNCTGKLLLWSVWKLVSRGNYWCHCSWPLNLSIGSWGNHTGNLL